VLETSLPIINPNPYINAIACSNVMVYLQSILYIASEVVFHEEALYQVYLPLPLPFTQAAVTKSNYECKKNCSLYTSYNGEMTHRKHQK